MTKLFINKIRFLFTVVILLFFFCVNAQQNTSIIDAQLKSEREKYGLTADDIKDYLITDQYTDGESGLTYAYIQQRHNKVIVYNAISVFLIRDNNVLYFKPGMIDNLAQKVKAASPSVTPEAAIGYALMSIGRNEIAPVKLMSTDTNLNTLTYESPSISASPIKVQLVYRAMDDGIFLAWDVSIELNNEPHWWNVRIDALTGNYLDKNDWTVNCSFDDPNDNCSKHEHEPLEPATPFSPLLPPPPLGEYNVYPFPAEAPSFGGRSNLINPEDLTSSPFGWHDVDGVVGNEYTITRGNNVHAYEDANNDNLPGYSPNSATLQFNYPVDLTQAPLVNQDASITNLFYLNNRIHDVLHHAGFTEAAGNFQQNNYGHGGLGNDYVQAEAFDGGGTNNANFGTPADGSKPRMQMYLWTAPNPDRDGSFDNGIVAHEYGHGVSNRLTGGPAQSSCLGNAEQGGEGWSDWLALILTIEPGDTVAGGMLTQARGIGTYALNQATTGLGIRRYRYSVNMAINPQTYADLATSGTGPHAKGEIWCDAIWDMTCFLVNDLGFNSDPTVATAGNNIAMRLVLEGMKLQPCSPGYINARNAILTADAVLYNNAHRCRIWEAFARRGMGFSALQGSATSSTDQTAAFDLPPVCLTATQPPVAAFTSNVSTIPCAGTVQFTNTSIQAFTTAWTFGDGGTSNLSNPTHQYASPGTYNVKLVVTNPLGSDSVVHPIIVTSTFTASLTATPNPVLCGSPVQLNAVGSGSANYNYALSTIPFAPVTGTPIAGPAGDDIVSGFIPIGFNFPYYNTVQTQLKISTNGFVSFNSNSGSGCCAGASLPNNSSTLSNMIAVAWTDLYVGAPNSVDYFNLTSPNRFVIRWNAVAHCCATTPAQVTVQIILYETGEIEMHNTSILTGGSVMTMGIENANGTVATVVPGRNASNFTASNEAYRFTPSVNYTYNWQPGNLNGASQTVSPIANTIYTVNVSDGSGCVQPFTTPIINVTPLNATISGSLSFCAGGSTTLDAGAGYTGYIWSTGATTQTISVNTAGTFTVTVTNSNGCTGASASVSTIVNPLPTPGITGTLAFCAGGSTTLNAGSYSSYLWNTGATTQTISVNTAGTFTVTVTNSNGCTGISVSVSTTVNPLPTPSITGTLAFCANGSTTLNAGAYSSYLWNTGATTQTISVNTAGTFTVTVTNGNGCTGTSASVTTIVNPLPTPGITGTLAFCAGGSTTLNAGVYSSYLWNTGATTQTISPTTAGTFTVTVTNGNGCAGTSASVSTTITPLPTAVISGNANVCTAGSANLTINFTGTAPWLYAINGGTPVSTSSNPETVSVSPVATTVYTITSFSDASCSATGTGSATVTVSATATLGNSVITSIPVNGCSTNVVSVTTNAFAAATSYIWSAPAGCLINGLPSPQTTVSNTVSITLGAIIGNSSGWQICVFAANACGQTNTGCSWIRGSLSTPAAITGSTIACPNTGPVNYSTAAVAGASSYLWTITGNATVTGTGTTGAVTFGPGFTTGQLCVRALLPCGYQSAQRCMTIANGTPILGTMIGTFTVCPGATNIAYSIPAAAGATNYTWTVPTGATITGGQGTNAITVSFGPTYVTGSICVFATSTCGIQSLLRCKTVASNKPNTPGNITGASTGVCGQNVTYSIAAVAGATSYTWSITGGGNFTTANGINSIVVVYPGVYTTGQLCVTANNGCGSSTPRCVTIKGKPANPGVITGPATVCANDASVAYSIASVYGATSYVWTLPAGATFVSGQGSTSIVMDYGVVGGTISVVASGSCGASGARNLTITMNCKLSSSALLGATVNAYPNPVSTQLNVELNAIAAGTYAVELIDVSGRVIYTNEMIATVGLNKNTIDVATIAKGVYTLSVKNADGFAKQIRVAVQ